MKKVLIVMPAYNEEKIISQNLKKLYEYAKANLSGYIFRIIVADNNSSDQTGKLVKELMAAYPEISYEFFEKKGKGLAVIGTWQKHQNDFDIFVFMDADLSTDLSSFPELLNSVALGNDIAIGSRYQKGAKVQKPLMRRIFSYGYRLLLQMFLDTKIKDFPCGFKAINKKTLEEVVPSIKNNQFFFDSEMLYLAERKGFKIKEIPVIWQEPREEKESKVNLQSVAWKYFKEVLRIKKENNPNKLSKNEKIFIWLSSLALATLTLIPTIFGYIIARGYSYSGLHLWFFDGNVYLSYINQIKDGNFLVHNLYSNELNNTPILSPFWLCVGLVARILKLSAPFVFQLARIIFIPIFLFTLYKFIAYFLSDQSILIKKLCFIYSLTAAGFGGYYTLHDLGVLQTNYFPMDVIVPEAVNFQLIFDSAHFIASLTLIILIFYYFLKAIENRVLKNVIIAGILSLLLFSFHPYYMLTIFVIPALYLLVLFIKNKKIDLDLVIYYILMVLISLPSLFYYAFLYFTNDFLRLKSWQNQCGSPTWTGFFIGYGAPILIAVFIQVYLSIERKLDNKKIFLMVWFWASVFLMYSPVVFQRRLSEGFQVPLMLLSFMGLVIFYNFLNKHLRLSGKVNYSCLLIIYLLFFCFSNIYIFGFSLNMLNGVAKKVDFVYVDQVTMEALNWYKKQTSYKETLLTSFGRGATIPALINRRVYFGHGMETVNAVQKGSEIEMFYKENINDKQKIDFLKNNRIDYVLYSSLEKVIGTFDPFSKNYLELVFKNDRVAIFKVR